MRIPLSWLLEYAAVPPGGAGGVAADEVARRLTAAGLEIEGIEHVGHDISGLVVAEVLDIEELTEFRKPVRYCRVSAGEAGEGAVPGACNGRDPPQRRPAGCAFHPRCAYVQESCKTEVPPLVPIGDGRLLACPPDPFAVVDR